MTASRQLTPSTRAVWALSYTSFRHQLPQSRGSVPVVAS